jgi:hypothetical protein
MSLLAMLLRSCGGEGERDGVVAEQETFYL